MIGDCILVTIDVPDAEAAIERIAAGCEGRAILAPSSIGVVVVDATPEQGSRLDELVTARDQRLAAWNADGSDDNAASLSGSVCAISDYVTSLAFGGGS